MKKSFLWIALTFFLIGGTGCIKNDLEKKGYTSIGLAFDITSKTGKSLINPTSKQGEEWLKKMQIEYKGIKYSYQGQPIRETRAIEEYFKHFDVFSMGGRFYLRFGEFQPNYREKQSLKLYLPNGMIQTIHFVYYTENNKLISKVWYDGKEEEGHIVKIITDPYLKEGEKEKSAPVYIYLINRIPLKELPEKYKKMEILYKGKTYKLNLVLPSEDGVETLNFETETGKMIPLILENCLYYKFGPFYPENDIKNEDLKLNTGEGVLNLYFSCYYDSQKRIVYDAGISPNDLSNKTLYFKNGPLVVLPL
ncbi:Uncharacterised protein [Porphyromonas macacae]|uniref:Lipoprotein n=1 Tax=Porphyromonas macacae TaxID=28115 RepID=A0A379E729_9PORP|nr:hypothetical protein [Porphyromonas macacae]SUB88495.1 Uncharacterised protein [Porphyromonas macacae]